MEVKTIMVVGAGLMGSGITEVSARAGYRVLWHDVKPEFVQRGQANIEDSLARRVAKKKITPEDRLTIQNQLKQNVSVAEKLDAAKEADLVIEAITENFELKTKLHATVGGLCRPETLIASNTSTLCITQLAACSKRPDRFIGMHFFSPVAVMRLVEIIRGTLTSDETYAAVYDVVAKLGKVSVLAPDVPGFLVNRVLMVSLNEALALVASGV